MGIQIIQRVLSDYPQLFPDFNQILPPRFNLVENVFIVLNLFLLGASRHA